MKSTYDRLKEFQRANEIEQLPSSAQLVMLHLILENNCLGNEGRVQITDAQMQHLTKLSHKTVIDARRRLKNVGLIDFKADSKAPRRGTLYILLDYTKEYTKESTKKSTKEYTKTRGGDLSPIMSRIKKTEDEESGARAAENSRKVAEAWLLWEGEKLRGGYALEMIELEREYGTEKLVEAINEAGKSNTRGRISVNYVKAILKKKGGKGNGAVGGRDETLEWTSPW